MTAKRYKELAPLPSKYGAAPPPAADAALNLITALVSFPVFLSYLRIRAPGRGDIRFVRWPHLVRLAQLMQQGEWLNILKARQIGISWLMAAYALWLCVTKQNSVVLILSKSQIDASEVMDRAMFMHERLPAFLRRGVRSQTKTEVTFDTGSRIISLPSTENAGRGHTANVVLGDEAAFHPFATANYQAYLPTVRDGGQLIMASTSAGPSGLFYSRYMAARRNQAGPVRAVFLPWWARPSRQLRNSEGRVVTDAQGQPLPDPDWMERTKAAFEGTEAEWRQEYPSNEREAWVVRRGLVYGIDDDGILIFSPDQHPTGNLSPDPCAWGDAWSHYASIDWGGGDPTAIGLYGILSSGRAHKFREFHYQGAIGVDRIAQWLGEWDPAKSLLTEVYAGKDEGTSIQSLRELGWNVVAAETDRKQGFSQTAFWLKQRRLTINPETCPYTLGEFDSYYWKVNRNPVTGESYATRTPTDHHGDHLDELRYFVMGAARNEVSSVLGTHEALHEVRW